MFARSLAAIRLNSATSKSIGTIVPSGFPTRVRSRPPGFTETSNIRQHIDWPAKRKMLETIGLIQVRHGQRMFVGDPDSLIACARLVRTAMAISPRDLLQFTEFRIAIEVHAARQAARVAADQDIAELESLCAEMDREEKLDEQAIRADFAFHQKLIEISGNELMLNVIKVLQEFFQAAMARRTRRPRDRDVSRPLHQAILEAIRAHSPEAAENAVQAHMEITRARLKSSLSSGQGAETAS